MTMGIDEVGRGPLAGPVVVAAVALPPRFKIAHLKFKRGELPLRDSKKLTASQREAWCAWIKNNPEIKYVIARVNPKTIDRINITQAANKAAYAAYAALDSKCKIHDFKIRTVTRKKKKMMIIVDAGLKLPKYISHKEIVKADEKFPAVALASIVAKVARDRYMTRQHKYYPQYNFATHKGYGTAQHIKLIKKYGLCPLHRLTFIKNISML